MIDYKTILVIIEIVVFLVLVVLTIKMIITMKKAYKADQKLIEVMKEETKTRKTFNGFMTNDMIFQNNLIGDLEARISILESKNGK